MYTIRHALHALCCRYRLLFLFIYPCCATLAVVDYALQGTQIQGTFWRESAEKYLDALQEGKVSFDQEL
jgi:hypothetical protein